MGYKRNRELKVYEICGYDYKKVPQIRLQGEWLKEMEFDIGTHINVECQSGRLIITRRDEVWDENTTS